MAGQLLVPFIIWRVLSLRTARDGVVLGPDAPHHDQLRYVLDQLTGQPARQVPGLFSGTCRPFSARGFLFSAAG